MKSLKNYSLKKFTTLAIGGQAKFFVIVKNEAELWAAISAAKESSLPWYVVGEGSNLIVADKGFDGVIIQNRLEKFDLFPPLPAYRTGRPNTWGGRPEAGRGSLVSLGAGNDLSKTIRGLNKRGLSGMEKMAGIPGTVGGAIYGCAGAYGQEIKDHLVRVRIFDGKRFRWLSRAQCAFGYRTSIFKNHKTWVILEAEFEMQKGLAKGLVKKSREIVKLRLKKYPKSLKCPGSFFKNIKLADLKPAAARKKFIKQLAPGKITHGKVPVGYLLEEVGAKGMRQGSIRVADHHGNLIHNANGGRAADAKKLATRLKSLVKKRFGITIEEEVQYLGY